MGQRQKLAYIRSLALITWDPFASETAASREAAYPAEVLKELDLGRAAQRR